nr:GIY-YIG nuclease family protein [Candidatus Njordarchaeota archaeon]
MPIGGDFYEWNENNAKGIAERAGAYALYDAAKDLIYIGSSSNLRERFTGYWTTGFEGDKCKQATRCYKREFTESYESGEKELLEEYRRTYGRLPRCNEVVP